MKNILVTAAVTLGAFCSQAQFSYNYLKAADTYYKKGDYYSAAQYYEKYLAGNGAAKKDGYDPYVIANLPKKGTTAASGNSAQALFNLAESYRKLNYYVKAEPAYHGLTTSADISKYPLAYYGYAVSERALGKYDAAEEAFNSFLANYKGTDAYTDNAKKELSNLQFIKKQLSKKDTALYHIAKGDATVNPDGANYAPSIANGNTVYFTSTRQTDAKAERINKVYEGTLSNGAVSGITEAGLPQAKNIHQGVISITPDGNTMFLTRWTIDKEGKSSSLYYSKKHETTWSEPVLLDNTINSAGKNTQQPFVTTDGKYLLFSSDKDGGMGGFDLYYAELDADGKPGAVKNMGSTINTAGDEQSPFYHSLSNTLVFASNGRVGMGGVDLFTSKGAIGSSAESVNMGYPVNSVKNDNYFTSDASDKNMLANALLSSDRSNDCCLQLFYLHKDRPTTSVSGLVIDCDSKAPIAGVSVKIVDDATNKETATKVTDADGRYAFTTQDKEAFKAIAEVKGYTLSSLQFNVPDAEDADVVTNAAICMRKEVVVPEVGAPVVMNHIYFELNKATVIGESSEEINNLVAMMKDNPNMTVEISGHTDSTGTTKHNQKLSQERADNVMKLLVNKGADKKRLTAKGYGATMPVAPNTNADGTDNADGRQLNRRTEFKITSK